MSDELKFGDDMPRAQKKGNPLIAKYGPGPVGTMCRTCINFLGDRKFFKCELRGVSNSHSTDHRMKWPTCAKYEGRPYSGRLKP